MSSEPQDPKITPLHAVPPPRVEDAIRADVVKLLEGLLTLARDGEVASLFIVVTHADGTYSEAISATQAFSQMIGQVEIVKQNWIGRYLAQTAEGRPLG